MDLNQLNPQFPHVQIEGVVNNSQACQEKFVFVAIQGKATDGHRFIDHAIAQGASVIIHEKPVQPKTGITYIQVENSEQVYHALCDQFYGHPSKKLHVFAVTGTNGKTTIATLIHQMLDDCGYIGTNGTMYHDTWLHTNLTTPESHVLQEMLAKMVEDGCQSVALEASSHGLDQHRLFGVHVDVAIFTNLTHDHLDYHHTMDEYCKAKQLLFQDLTADDLAVINGDDPYAKRFIECTKAKVYTYGLDPSYTMYLSDGYCGTQYSTFNLHFQNQTYALKVPLLGLFNLYNFMAVVCALSKYLSIQEIIERISKIQEVDGRMIVMIEKGKHVIVDYAHTPDGFEKIFAYVRPLTKKLTVIFSSAGARDHDKRPILGQIADSYCDKIILTLEDPRQEDVVTIDQDIASGIKKNTPIFDYDRKHAIQQAIQDADQDEIVLILGKGNEQYLAIGQEKTKYDGDVCVAKEILDQL